MERDSLLKRQEQLEDDGLAAGAARFRNKLQQAAQSGRGAQAGGAKRLLQESIDPVADALAQIVEESRSRAGRKHQVEQYIKALGPDTVAYITVKTVLDLIAVDPTVRVSALHITSLMIDEMRYRRFREQAPGLFDYRMGSFNTGHYAHKKRSLDAAMKYAEIGTDDLDAAPGVRLAVGIKLIDVMIETTGLVELKKRWVKDGRKMKRDVYLAPTEDTLSWLHARNGAMEFLQPVAMPMVVPPLPWKQGHTRGSGYRFALRFKYPLVRHLSKTVVESVKDQEMPAVYQALNAIQATPWRINPKVLALVEDIVKAGGDMAGIPSLVDKDLPVRPEDIATNKEARREWRRRAHKVKEANHIRKLAALDFYKKLHIALTMRDDEAIYFPCTLDFRGRVYPIPQQLTPQGDDLSKGLLTFAESKPVCDASWLAIHGANCLGTAPDGVKLSKGTLSERVAWVQAHTKDIEAVANDPFSHRWWTEADEPLQFFAFCVEWAGYTDSQRMGRPYSSCLPCGMDGTCNGLQHFAAMFRDPIGGEAVNVIPTERPQDIYQRVADRVMARLERESDNEFARMWLVSGLVDRKLAKRPTMTFPYGSKKYGFQSQLLKFLTELEADERERIKPIFTNAEGDDVALKACGYMAGLIWDALQDIVSGASRGMAWMQEAARLVCQSGRCVEWTVPGTNFPVLQEYRKFTERQVKTILAGKIFMPRVRDYHEDPDAKKQANAVAPNFVHSLDAAALMLTVNRSLAAGVTSFGMVHDSYATHAADCEVLARETREAFIGLYEDHDVVSHFATQLWHQAPNKELPLPPDSGALSLSDIRKSLYFFS